MSFRADLTFSERARNEDARIEGDEANSVMSILCHVAERKESNIVLSTEVTTTKELLEIAETAGPYIAVFKTHIDLIVDFSDATIKGLKSLAKKYNFLLFEDRKLSGTGDTVYHQYRHGMYKLYRWAHLVSVDVPALGAISTSFGAQSLLSSGSENFNPSRRGFLIVVPDTNMPGPKGRQPHPGEVHNFFSTEGVHWGLSLKRKVVGFLSDYKVYRSLAGMTYQTHLHSSDLERDFLVFSNGGNPVEQIHDHGADFVSVAFLGLFGASEVDMLRKDCWEAYLMRRAELVNAYNFSAESTSSPQLLTNTLTR